MHVKEPSPVTANEAAGDHWRLTGAVSASHPPADFNVAWIWGNGESLSKPCDRYDAAWLLTWSCSSILYCRGLSVMVLNVKSGKLLGGSIALREHTNFLNCLVQDRLSRPVGTYSSELPHHTRETNLRTWTGTWARVGPAASVHADNYTTVPCSYLSDS